MTQYDPLLRILCQGQEFLELQILPPSPFTSPKHPSLESLLTLKSLFISKRCDLYSFSFLLKEIGI